MKGTFTVRGQKLRCASLRRFILVSVRPEPIHYMSRFPDGRPKPSVYVAFAHIERRSDSVETLRKERSRRGVNYHGMGVLLVIIDTTTGEEV